MVKDLTVDEVSRRTGYRLYGECGHNYLADHAETQLQGRSHYYDADTRRYFKSRVNHLIISRDGLLLCTVESVLPPDGRRAHRAVVHDLRGNTIYRSELTSKSSKAYDSLVEFLKSYPNTEDEAARILLEERIAIERKLAQLNANSDDE